MENRFIILDNIALELQLLAVDGFTHVVDTHIGTIEQHFDHLTARTVAHVGDGIGIPRLAGHVEPQVGADAVAHAQEIDLASIQQPAVIIAQSKKTMIFLGRVLLVQKLDVIIALVASIRISCIATPFYLGEQRFSES